MSNMCPDQVIITNALNTQKLLTANYNTAAGECANNQLRCAMMDLWKDEHEIQNDIFVDMNSRCSRPSPSRSKRPNSSSTAKTETAGNTIRQTRRAPAPLWGRELFSVG